jgi:hypothetical protein
VVQSRHSVASTANHILRQPCRVGPWARSPAPSLAVSSTAAAASSCCTSARGWLGQIRHCARSNPPHAYLKISALPTCVVCAAGLHGACCALRCALYVACRLSHAASGAMTLPYAVQHRAALHMRPHPRAQRGIAQSRVRQAVSPTGQKCLATPPTVAQCHTHSGPVPYPQWPSAIRWQAVSPTGQKWLATPRWQAVRFTLVWWQINSAGMRAFRTVQASDVVGCNAYKPQRSACNTRGTLHTAQRATRAEVPDADAVHVLDVLGEHLLDERVLVCVANTPPAPLAPSRSDGVLPGVLSRPNVRQHGQSAC